MVKKLLESVRENKKYIWLTVLFMVLEVVLECLIPFLTARLVNHIENSSEMRIVLRLGGQLLLLALLSLLFSCAGGIVSSKASTGYAGNLRHDLYYKIQDFSFANIDRFTTASLVTRMTTDVGNVQMAFMMTLRTAARAPLMLIFSIVMAYVMGGSLATSFVVIVPLLGLGLYLLAKAAMPAFHRVFRKYDRINESIEENVRGMRVVKGFVREDAERKKFFEASDSVRIDFTKAERIVALNNPLMQVCIYFNMVFVLLVGSKLVVTYGGSVIGVGEITAMLTYGMQVMIQLMMLSMIFVMLTISLESMKRITEVLNEESTLISPENAVTSVPSGAVDFDGVSFKYAKNAKKDALSNIELHVASGMTVGILGGTGVGKTSLVQLIPRLYDATEGTVRVGGTDVRDYNLKVLRDSVAMVLQKNELFSGTIRENLLWGNADATDGEIAEACRLAQAEEFILSFPEGYETRIEQGGTNVSGGQKQRLCIARALLKKPKILILDDSTSAVDMRTDALIRKGFSDYIPETTKIIIAQRVASVQDADLILVMENGRIAEQGTHEELLLRGGIYREIYEQQTHGFASEEEGGADSERE